MKKKFEVGTYCRLHEHIFKITKVKVRKRGNRIWKRYITNKPVLKGINYFEEGCILYKYIEVLPKLKALLLDEKRKYESNIF